jgi:ubiquinone/menaquinone biosynthesis C-methylase UbiE
MNHNRPTCAALVALAVSAAVIPAAARQLAARPAEEWIKMLDAPARVAGLRVGEVVEKLRLEPGDVVADLGAGAGAFSLPLARAVAPGGKVYAVEIDEGLVDYIARKAKDHQVANVHALLGRFADPALPASDVDVAFMHDVLHHIENRPAFLRNASKYLKADGRFAFVELDAKTGAHKDDPKLQVTKEQLAAWMADIGFHLSEEFQIFNDKWYVVYARKR